VSEFPREKIPALSSVLLSWCRFAGPASSRRQALFVSILAKLKIFWLCKS
jgi:hypothetical protein